MTTVNLCKRKRRINNEVILYRADCSCYVFRIARISLLLNTIIYLGGKYAIDPNNTDDIDICLTGPVYDYNSLFNLLKTGTDLGLNKHNILIDIKHYDNLNFFKYPRNKNFNRYHISIELAGEVKKIVNDKVEVNYENKTHIPVNDIPKELAVNLIQFPLLKQIKDGRIYDPIKLN